jgi:hypothetical protein
MLRPRSFVLGAEAVVGAIPAPAHGPNIRIPSVLWCGLMIFVVKTALQARGLGWTIGWIRRRVGSISDAALVDAEEVKAAERAVAMAGALYPGRAKCLEQSLVLYCLLRRQRVPIEFRLGVQPQPFLAHAWIEYQGEPINDVAEHVRQFVPMGTELR